MSSWFLKTVNTPYPKLALPRRFSGGRRRSNCSCSLPSQEISSTGCQFIFIRILCNNPCGPWLRGMGPLPVLSLFILNVKKAECVSMRSSDVI